MEAKRAVAWTIRNRAQNPSWWGSGYADVILKPYQFSSFNSNDPNATKLPRPSDPSWLNSMQAAKEAWWNQGPDPTGNATHYFDDSIPKPSWTASMTPTLKVGKLNFYREVF